jgi:DNA-binding response OmpR family regulator
MDDYLAKPFDQNELGLLLQRHLARAGARGGAPG